MLSMPHSLRVGHSPHFLLRCPALTRRDLLQRFMGRNELRYAKAEVAFPVQRPAPKSSLASRFGAEQGERLGHMPDFMPALPPKHSYMASVKQTGPRGDARWIKKQKHKERQQIEQSLHNMAASASGKSAKKRPAQTFAAPQVLCTYPRVCMHVCGCVVSLFDLACKCGHAHSHSCCTLAVTHTLSVSLAHHTRTHMHILTLAQTFSLKHMRAQSHTNTHTLAGTNQYVRMRSNTHARTRTRINKHTHAHARAHTHTHTHKYTHTHTHIHIHIQTHLHVVLLAPRWRVADAFARGRPMLEEPLPVPCA